MGTLGADDSIGWNAHKLVVIRLIFATARHLGIINDSVRDLQQYIGALFGARLVFGQGELSARDHLTAVGPPLNQVPIELLGFHSKLGQRLAQGLIIEAGILVVFKLVILGKVTLAVCRCQ